MLQMREIGGEQSQDLSCEILRSLVRWFVAETLDTNNLAGLAPTTSVN